ncbi:hypothetical protein [Streptomyces blattellae]|uniref:hypothetical protein n=1 Tax=Streptomyces blattellae TaxID=2569855 RepID=UPI0012B98498|nr:hypothetical protein [Streptomyces blattellae]
MSGIAWPEDPKAFEKGVAVLLSRMHPDIQRIDGAGGDGGRDAQLTDHDGLHVFEMKSFTGRMTDGRRNQVESSLARAARLRPVTWDLVVPIDPTPGELQWFNTLRAQYPFELEWRGAAWIEARLTEHPQVRRFYFANAMAETEELLRQLVPERGPIANVGEAVQRMRRMIERLAELEPHYQFRMTAGPGADSMVEMLPAYPGAVQDRPAGFWVAFADTPEAKETAQAWERAIAFGDAVEVPGEHIADFRVNGPAVLGIPHGQPGPGMRLRVAAHEVPADHTAHLVVTDAQGQRMAVLGLRMTGLRMGTRGSVLSGTDVTGSYECQLRMDHSAGALQIKLKYEAVDRLRPTARLEAVRFAASLLPHHTLDVMLAGQPLTESVPVPTTEGMDQRAADTMIELLEQLAAIEKLAVTTFELPMDIPRDDKAAVRTAYALLTGRTAEVDATMTATLTADDTPQIRKLAATNGLVRGTGLVDDYRVEILGQSIPIGPVTMETPPLQVTGVRPADDGLELSVRTAPDHADQPVRLTRYNSAEQQPEGFDPIE